MKNLVVILLLVCSLGAWAGPGSTWNEGVVILGNNVKIEGEISFDHRKDIVQVKTNGTTKAYSSYNVKGFQYYDPRLNITRTFNSEALPSKYNFNRKTFYEVVLSGDFQLLRKEKFRWEAPGASNGLQKWVDETYENESPEYAYFISQNSSIEKIRNFQKQVLPLMADQEKEVSEFINNNDFNFQNPSSHILIINYYNHLKDLKKSLSKAY